MIRPDPGKLEQAWDAVLASGYEKALRPLLFTRRGADPEVAHEQMIDLLARLPHPLITAGKLAVRTTGRPVTVSGIDFPNPIGVAAGLDKDARAVDAWAAFGFGFVEVGTVTPVAQPGNDKPRLFRLVASRAIINRMGFNNQGAESLAERLRAARPGIPVGVSIGKNKVTPNDRALDDYRRCLDHVAAEADYVAINVSSPNTPGLRGLQDADQLHALVRGVVDHAAGLDASRPVPVWVKLAPDLDDHGLTEAVRVCADAGAGAIIATNTTLARRHLALPDHHLVGQTGGLSGAPLTERAREVVNLVAGLDLLPVVGVGGVMTGDDAAALVEAGASLVQLYTGFIYGGPALVRRCVEATR